MVPEKRRLNNNLQCTEKQSEQITKPQVSLKLHLQQNKNSF